MVKELKDFDNFASISLTVHSYYKNLIGNPQFTHADIRQALITFCCDHLLLPDDLSSFVVRDQLLHNLIRQSEEILKEHGSTQTIKQSLQLLINFTYATALILGRFKTDYQDISTLINGASASRVTDVAVLVGDSHCNGCRVATVTLENAVKLVYKPRSLLVDAYFQWFVSWLNLQLPRLHLRPYKTIQRSDYGWTEFIPHKYCETAEEINGFYTRCGRYLACFHLLSSTDMHFENLIAFGEYPVFVDLETLITPKVHSPNPLGRDYHSVVDTFVLPQVFGIPTRALDDQTKPITPFHKQKVDDFGALAYMRLEYETTRKVHVKYNLPISGQLPLLDIDRCILHLCSGFEEVYDIFVKFRSFLTSRKFIGRLEYLPIRVLVRSTRSYIQLLRYITSDHGASERERLFAALKESATRSTLYSHTIESELRDLNNGDVPYFTTTVNSTIVKDSHGQNLCGIIEQSALDCFKTKVSRLGSQDKNIQLWFIQNSFRGALSYAS